jgi:hypothetical protein
MLWNRGKSLATARIRTPAIHPVVHHYTEWARRSEENSTDWNGTGSRKIEDIQEIY